MADSKLAPDPEMNVDYPAEPFASLEDKVNHDIAVETWSQKTLQEKLEYEKKLVRKLDLRLVPVPTLLYFLSFLDRTNIGNAKVQGVQSPFVEINESWE